MIDDRVLPSAAVPLLLPLPSLSYRRMRCLRDGSSGRAVLPSQLFLHIYSVDERGRRPEKPCFRRASSSLIMSVRIVSAIFSLCCVMLLHSSIMIILPHPAHCVHLLPSWQPPPHPGDMFSLYFRYLVTSCNHIWLGSIKYYSSVELTRTFLYIFGDTTQQCRFFSVCPYFGECSDLHVV